MFVFVIDPARPVNGLSPDARRVLMLVNQCRMSRPIQDTRALKFWWPAGPFFGPGLPLRVRLCARRCALTIIASSRPSASSRTARVLDAHHSFKIFPCAHRIYARSI